MDKLDHQQEAIFFTGIQKAKTLMDLTNRLTEMSDTLTCKECGKTFSPTKNTRSLIDESKTKLMHYLMVECQECGRFFSINPMDTGENHEPVDYVDQITIRCPVSKCHGWVSYIQANNPEDKSFWGCGECGSVWYKKETLIQDINLIVKKYSYRKNCYNIKKTKILPQNINDEIKNYEYLVKKEEKDNAKSFVRG